MAKRDDTIARASQEASAPVQLRARARVTARGPATSWGDFADVALDESDSTSDERPARNSSRPRPTFDVEARAIDEGAGLIAGIDEAGRGPWAGPVVAAAVILEPRSIPDGLDDSKALDSETRERLYAAIFASGARVAVGIADVRRIDRMNILQATMWAMSRATAALPCRPGLILVDGNRLPALECPARAIIGGDATSLSIAAASIIAKVTRDRIMTELSLTLPGYGFERHKGYGTPEHRAALDRLGPSAQHRRSFRPIRIALGEI